MSEIEPCPCCGGKMCHDGMWKCEKVMCPYQVRPDPRSIAAHNELSIKIQQLKHFAELAKPIVKYTKLQFEVRMKTRGKVQYQDCFHKCNACLAALPGKQPKTAELVEKGESDDNL